MRQKQEAKPGSAEKTVRDIRRATRLAPKLQGRVTSTIRSQNISRIKTRAVRNHSTTYRPKTGRRAEQQR